MATATGALDELPTEYAVATHWAATSILTSALQASTRSLQLRLLRCAPVGMTRVGGGWGNKKGPALCRAFCFGDVLDQAADRSSVGPRGNSFDIQAPDGLHFLGIRETEYDGSQG